MDKMKLTKLAKAAIFGFCYYLILNLYLFLALAHEGSPHGHPGEQEYPGRNVWFGIAANPAICGFFL